MRRQRHAPHAKSEAHAPLAAVAPDGDSSPSLAPSARVAVRSILTILTPPTVLCVSSYRSRSAPSSPDAEADEASGGAGFSEGRQSAQSIAPSTHSPHDSHAADRPPPKNWETKPPTAGPAKRENEVTTPMRPNEPVRFSLGAVSAK